MKFRKNMTQEMLDTLDKSIKILRQQYDDMGQICDEAQSVIVNLPHTAASGESVVHGSNMVFHEIKENIGHNRHNLKRLLEYLTNTRLSD